jgi:hypothetical protein
MDLYTLIIDYKGGTFISQCLAPCKEDAIYNGIFNWDISEIEDVISGNARNMLLEDIENEELISLDGVTNVWSCSLFSGKELMLLNLVATKKDT